MNTFTTTAYNPQGQAVEHETINDTVDFFQKRGLIS